MKTLVLANQKGGVGKSAVATQLAYYFHKIGARVLFVDLDHQRNSSVPLTLSGLVQVASFTSSQFLDVKGQELPEGRFVLVGGDDHLSAIERQADKHNNFVNNLNAFLKAQSARFDCCIIDTNPNPDVRYAASLIVADFVLSPVQLNQEALSGIGALLSHPRYGYRKIKQALNHKLELIGILPNLVEPTPFQRENLKQLVENHAQLLIVIDPNAKPKRFAFIPKRSAVAEAQAAGQPLFDMKKTSARDAWLEIKPSFDVVAQRMNLEISDAA
jgi:chromosome partitioning protein